MQHANGICIAHVPEEADPKLFQPSVTPLFIACVLPTFPVFHSRGQIISEIVLPIRARGSKLAWQMKMIEVFRPKGGHWQRGRQVVYLL